MSPSSRFLATLPVCLCVGLCLPAHAQPAPVATGLWEVRLLTSFEPDPAPGALFWPDFPNRLRARSQRICLDAERAQAPVVLARTGPAAEVVFDRSSVSVSYAEHLPGAAAPAQRAVDGGYRRIDSHNFEGSHDLVTAGHARRTQFMARWLAADCGGMLPAPLAGLDEP